MKEGVTYEVGKETVTRVEKLSDGKEIILMYRGRDFGGDSLERFRLNRAQETDGIPVDSRVTLPKREQTK